MAINRIDDHTSRIDNPAFQNVVFSADSSPGYLGWPSAVAFARERNAVLQSAREAAAFRIEANGQDDANQYCITRTVVAYFKDGDTWRAAIDDSADSEQNILLARADEGYNAHKAGNNWLVPKSDMYMKGLLERAGRAGRIVPVPESRLELATRAASGSSPFGQHVSSAAIFGTDIAEAYAGFLNQNRCLTGEVYSLTAKTLEGMNIGDENTEIRLVGLGGVDGDFLNGVFANSLCCSGGRARGGRPVSADSTH